MVYVCRPRITFYTNIDCVVVLMTQCIGCKKVKEYCEKKDKPNLYEEWQIWKKRVAEIGVDQANKELGYK